MRPHTPRVVSVIVGHPAVWFLARLALRGAYLLGGLTKLTDWQGALAEQAHFGVALPALSAALTIAVELIGPLLILSGQLVWLGSGMLGVFTLLAAIVANNFWAMPEGQDRFMAMNAFFEHIGLIGGFVLVAMLADRRER
ncbi:DoxX family protein [Martelella mediterranea]|uniref:DoxX n=1 Tax=Martelella mediterranea DSM 17316 TaxID=1122214 RepID=A0A1U9Z3H3_9HYPH|nr:DoxX family protein [Martelella mediterranea]AQZ52241.1 DoxX [Martelella mediterranea DSM 17316]